MSTPTGPVVRLLPGDYLIQAKTPQLYLAADEAQPLLPKKVFTLPHGTLAPKWTVEAIDERRYYLKINNAPTAAIDNKVYALQVWQPTPEHEIWVIQNRPQFGANVFTISSTNGVTQWAVEHDAPYTQVVMRHAGLMPENPTADALFVFTRVH